MKDDAGNPAKTVLFSKLSRSFLAAKRKFMEYKKHTKTEWLKKWSKIPTKTANNSLKIQIKMGLKREFQPQSGAGCGIRTHVGCPKRFSRPPRYDRFDNPAHCHFDSQYYTIPHSDCQGFFQNCAGHAHRIRCVFLPENPGSSPVRSGRGSRCGCLRCADTVRCCSGIPPADGQKRRPNVPPPDSRSRPHP